MYVDHVSVAVRDLEAARQRFGALFPIVMHVPRTPGYSGDFEWCDFYVGAFKIELIAGTQADSFVHRFIDKRGEGLHHLSIDVPQLEPVVRRMEAGGVRIVDRFEGGGGATAFTAPRSAHGVLIQFWQLPAEEVPERPSQAALVLRSGERVRMRVDHIAVAVRALAPALEFFRRYFPRRAKKPSPAGERAACHPGLQARRSRRGFLASTGPRCLSARNGGGDGDTEHSGSRGLLGGFG